MILDIGGTLDVAKYFGRMACHVFAFLPLVNYSVLRFFMNKLSPDAQAVLDAASISVALRALVRNYGVKTRGGFVYLNGHDVLAIAAELEEAVQLSLQPHLSVEAQAVLDAYSKVANSNILNGSRWIEAAIAAVLRAAVDQARDKLFTIIAELERING